MARTGTISGGGGGGVTTLNGLAGAITLAGSASVVITPGPAGTFTFTAPGGAGMVIGNPVTGGSANAVLYIDAAGDLAQDPGNFEYDDTTGKLTVIGVIDPTQVLLHGPSKKFGATDAGTVFLAPFVDAIDAIEIRKADGVTSTAVFNTINGHAAFGIGTVTDIVPFAVLPIVVNVGETVTTNSDLIGVVSYLDINPIVPYISLSVANNSFSVVPDGNIQDFSGATLIGNSGSGRYGGTNLTNTNFFIAGSNFDASNNDVGNVNFAVGSTNSVYNNSTGTIDTALGFSGNAENITGGTIGLAVGAVGEVNNSGAGTIGVGVGVAGIINNTAAGTITTASSLLAQTPTNTGTINFLFGLDIKDHSGIGVIDSWNIYSEGVASFNIFEGSIGAGLGVQPNNTIQVASLINFDDALENTFLGKNTGAANTTGPRNTFVGYNAGVTNITGGDNTFVGREAGRFSTGDSNTLVGGNAGGVNSTGNFNSFFGNLAGASNTTGSNNAFFGQGAGVANIAGGSNTFLGASSGTSNTASSNTFVGNQSGVGNTTGTLNVFVGGNAGFSHTTGDSNTFLGTLADSTAGTEDNSVALGYLATVDLSNQIVFGQTGTPVNNWKVAGIDWVMPAAQGGVNTQLTNDGAGNLTWGGGAGFNWNSVGVNTAIVVNNGYITTAVGNVNLTLPAASAVGDIFEVVAGTTGGWTILEGAGQTLHLGNANATTTTGSLASTDVGDAIRMVCTVANLDWRALSVIGNITVV